MLCQQLEADSHRSRPAKLHTQIGILFLARCDQWTDCVLHSQGELEMWNRAEASLSDALNAVGRPWTINEGEKGSCYPLTYWLILIIHNS